MHLFLTHTCNIPHNTLIVPRGLWRRPLPPISRPDVSGTNIKFVFPTGASARTLTASRSPDDGILVMIGSRYPRAAAAARGPLTYVDHRHHTQHYSFMYPALSRYLQTADQQANPCVPAMIRATIQYRQVRFTMQYIKLTRTAATRTCQNITNTARHTPLELLFSPALSLYLHSRSSCRRWQDNTSFLMMPQKAHQFDTLTLTRVVNVSSPAGFALPPFFFFFFRSLSLSHHPLSP